MKNLQEKKYLKCDFHLHTNDDLVDRIRQTVFDVINMASEQSFDVLSITNHSTITFSDEINDYAKEKNILLIKGIELYVERKHVVILNCSEDILKVKTISDLKAYKNNNSQSFIFAPHPYYPKKSCLGKIVEENIDLFDGLEYCHFYISFINHFNEKAERIAKKFSKPLIANSDSHSPIQFGRSYSLVKAEKNVESVIENMKLGNIKIVTQPLPIFRMLKILIKVLRKRSEDELLKHSFK